MPSRTWLDKEKEAEAHRAEVEMATPGTIIAYSDGSKHENGNAGAGWAITEDGATLEEGHVALGKWMEVADAEAIGALKAARRATARDGTEEIWLCLDNQGIVNRLRNPSTRNSTSQDVIDETKTALRRWASESPERRVHVLWVPGHMGLKVNELADAVLRRNLKFLEERQQPERPEATQPPPTASTET
ncbi:uncharacterized protein BROUX77_007300 [Berkeleyomyces rouxiae]|uniref:uncharacterized protein n=1 Tax=Berkeleyomyces rouxiae TaxID=2035830 RepID=UPI003B80F268